MPGQESVDPVKIRSFSDAQLTLTEGALKSPPICHIGTESCQKPRRRPQSQPPNTTCYTVKANDKLTSIAAFYDITPSTLKKLNRLTIDFLYPEQLLYVPVCPENDGFTTNSDIYTSSGSSCEDEKITRTTNHEEQLSPSGIRYPGSAHRVIESDSACQPASSSGDVNSTGSKRNSQQEQCLLQMFVKLPSNYIISEEGEEVNGILLVTPNAVMFDPNVSDPLVIEKGVEEYGMIAKLDTVISAAIYRDSQAMHNLHLQKDDPARCEPEIYHMKDCELRRQDDHPSQSEDETAGSEEHSDTVLSCSCAAESSSTNGPTQCDESTADLEKSHHNTSNLETSKVTFEIDDEARSSPINLAGMTINPQGLETADECEIDYDLGDETISRSIEQKINAFPKKLSHKRTASSASSLFSVGITSNTEVYVNYSCGMFAANGSISSADKELIRNGVRDNNTQHLTSNEIGDEPDGAQASKSFTMHLEAGVSKEERPNLFQPISDLVLQTSKSQEAECQPFYLCLQVGQPINNRHVTDTCPIEAYKERRKPEYWFTIPGDKVDSLYAFFIQWRPELYGEEITDEAMLNSRGFVAIPAAGLGAKGLPDVTCSPMVRQISRAQVFKDWEILSIDEIVRQRSLLDIEKYLPLPELVGESLLLSEQDIKQLATLLPARVEGHRWRLAYSNEDHGFSLSTLYRNMCEFDSATILIVQDENNGLFGAFSSSPVHLCEHFYGNGECFLFTYVDGFKSFSWSGKNMFCVQGGQHGLTIGTGSATCGLWLDADLYHGRTQHCDTFDNEPLTGGAEDFIVKSVEIWSLNDEEFD